MQAEPRTRQWPSQAGLNSPSNQSVADEQDANSGDFMQTYVGDFQNSSIVCVSFVKDVGEKLNRHKTLIESTLLRNLKAVYPQIDCCINIC